MRVPEEVMLQAVRDLNERSKNDGSWPNGIPASYHQIRDAYGFTEPWVHTVDVLVGHFAVTYLAVELYVKETLEALGSY